MARSRRAAILSGGGLGLLLVLTPAVPVGAQVVAPGLAAAAPPAMADTPATAGRMSLVRSDRRLPVTGDPVWELRLQLPGQDLRVYEALVGRARRQEGDRDRLGSRAPLPRGLYRVSGIVPVQPDDDPELGRFLWIGLDPQFPTHRKGLGIHQDPSAGFGRQSGTDGCIGLIHGNDLLVLGALLERSGTRDLVVED